VRTRTHKLIYFDRIKQWELYDLTKDPAEVNNVYAAREYADVVKKLKAELKRLQTQLKDDPADVGSKPRTGFEKTRPPGRAPEQRTPKPRRSIDAFECVP